MRWRRPHAKANPPAGRGKDFSHDYIAWHLGYRFDGLPFPLNR